MGTTITGCNFNCTVNGLEKSPDEYEAILTVAQALRNLTELFQVKPVTIESLVKITPDKAIISEEENEEEVA